MNAQEHLRTYVKRNRSTMTPTQIRAATTTARQIGGDMTIDVLADLLHETLTTPAQTDMPIYGVGSQTASYVLALLADQPHQQDSPLTHSQRCSFVVESSPGPFG